MPRTQFRSSQGFCRRSRRALSLRGLFEHVVYIPLLAGQDDQDVQR